MDRGTDVMDHCLALAGTLTGVVQHQVHVLVKANDAPLYSEISLVVEPYLNDLLALQVSKNKVDRPEGKQGRQPGWGSAAAVWLSD